MSAKVMVRWSNVVESGIIMSDSLQGKYVNAYFLLCLQVFLLSSPDIIACLIGISSDPRGNARFWNGEAATLRNHLVDDSCVSLPSFLVAFLGPPSLFLAYPCAKVHPIGELMAPI